MPSYHIPNTSSIQSNGLKLNMDVKLATPIKIKGNKTRKQGHSVENFKDCRLNCMSTFLIETMNTNAYHPNVETSK